MEEKKVTISGIIMNDSQKMLVCSQDNARKLLGYLMMVVVFRIYSGIEGVLYTPAITAQSIILTIVIVIACYAVSLLVVRRKADKEDMVESLKDNRE